MTYTHRSSFLHALKLLQVDVMAVAARETVLAVVPMFHANAWGLPFAAPAAGARLVLAGRRTDGADLARLIADERVTPGVGVPTVWLGLLEHVEAHDLQLPSLERIVVGGAPMPPAPMVRLEERLGVRVQTSWGMTELSPSGVVAPVGDPSRSASVAGKPATDADGWFATGDLGRIEAAGNLVITGRAKDLIESGGEWINPAEIEAVVGADPRVALAAAIGRADAKWGERPVLIVELAQDASDAELLGALKGRIASWWTQDAVIRLETMPLAPTGKIDKLTLRARYAN